MSSTWEQECGHQHPNTLSRESSAPILGQGGVGGGPDFYVEGPVAAPGPFGCVHRVLADHAGLHLDTAGKECGAPTGGALRVSRGGTSESCPRAKGTKPTGHKSFKTLPTGPSQHAVLAGGWVVWKHVLKLCGER